MKKLSLVIGINKYNNFGDLDNCINDANDIHSFLSENGFESELITNTKQEEIILKVAQFKKKVTKNTISLIYFSGHGVKDDKYNYLVTSDSNIRIRQDIKYNCLLADDLLIEETENNLHILILDACRNLPLSIGTKEISIGLLKMNAPSGTLIAFSTSPNSVSIERKNERNGVYTKHLLNHIKEPNLPIELVFKKTRDGVINDTSRKQIPWEESSLTGKDFSFIIEKDEITKTIEKWLKNEKITLIKLLTLIENKNSKKLPLEKVHLILILSQISFEKERNGETQTTIDQDYFSENMIDNLFPKFQKRIQEEYYSDRKFNFEEINGFKIKNTNYGFNFLNCINESFPQLITNEIEFKEKKGVLSFFLSSSDKKYFLKPIIIFKEPELTFIEFSIETGNNAQKIIEKFYEIRKPHENEKPHPTITWDVVKPLDFFLKKNNNYTQHSINKIAK